MLTEADQELCILILAPTGRDASLLFEILKANEISAKICSSAEATVQEINRGAGAALIAEEALVECDVITLSARLDNQPPWSDLPIIVMTGGGNASRSSNNLVETWKPLGNLTLVERPLRIVTLISTMKSALRARKKQYEIRRYLLERQRSEAQLELVVENRTSALRSLSSKLMHLQDEERRHIARELHDSLGQYLAVLGMNLDQIADSGVLNKAQLLQAKQSLSQCILETRTLSHLLHPPLLDELGLEAAIRSFVEGYTERSGIKVNLTISSLRRFDNAAETALFRIIQEGLTNLHRHSGSQTADIILGCEKDHVQLDVRDYGKGIPEHVLTTYRRTGTGVGVGIAGMHERVAELHGRLELHSDGSGTRIRISLPIRQSELQ